MWHYINAMQVNQFLNIVEGGYNLSVYIVHTAIHFISIHLYTLISQFCFYFISILVFKWWTRYWTHWHAWTIHCNWWHFKKLVYIEMENIHVCTEYTNNSILWCTKYKLCNVDNGCINMYRRVCKIRPKIVHVDGIYNRMRWFIHQELYVLVTNDNLVIFCFFQWHRICTIAASQ